MFEKILVALDQSPTGEVLFQKALILAKRHHAKLMLLHILTSEEEGSPIPIPSEASNMYWDPGLDFNLDVWRKQWETYEGECLDKLRSLSAKANQAQVPTEFRQIPGNAGRVICDFATAWGTNLILIGNRGRSGLQEWVLGSVSNYVLHHAHCDVLTVKTR